jgi:hypothetical protein
MKALKYACTILGMVVAAYALDGVAFVSIACEKHTQYQYSCIVGDFSTRPWSARGSLDAESINTTGWGRLVVESNESVPQEETAFASGFIEGYLTWELIDLAWLSGPRTPSPRAAQFVQQSIDWVNTSASAKGPSDRVWMQAGLVLHQQRGLYEGYALGAGGRPALTYAQLLYLGMGDDLGDIEHAVNVSSRPAYNRMTAEEIRWARLQDSHCSALVKVPTPRPAPAPMISLHLILIFLLYFEGI